MPCCPGPPMIVLLENRSRESRADGHWRFNDWSGRALRAVIDTRRLGEPWIWIDCDVIQADGGTRTASITGSFIALAGCHVCAGKEGLVKVNPLTDYLAAISIGKVGGQVMVDLAYESTLAR